MTNNNDLWQQKKENSQNIAIHGLRRTAAICDGIYKSHLTSFCCFSFFVFFFTLFALFGEQHLSVFHWSRSEARLASNGDLSSLSEMKD